MRYEIHLKHGEQIVTGDATGSSIENAVDVLASTNALLVVLNEDGSKIVIPRENVAYITIAAATEPVDPLSFMRSGRDIVLEAARESGMTNDQVGALLRG